VAEGNASVRRARTPYGGKVAERPGLVSIVLGVLNLLAFAVTALTSPGGFTGNIGSKLFDELELVPIRVAAGNTGGCSGPRSCTSACCTWPATCCRWRSSGRRWSGCSGPGGS
jgi:hypothetical protein